MHAPIPCPPREPVQYALVFSLGYDCNASLALRRAGLQFNSYPFDWTTRAPLRARAAALASGFANWLAPAGLSDCGEASFDRFSVRHRVVVDQGTGLEFRHDFPLELSLEEGLPAVAAKYARRTGRLLSALRSSGRVLAVFTAGFRHESLPMAELEEAYDILSSAFGDRIDLLGVCDDHPDSAHAPVWTSSRGGRVLRASIAFGFHSAQGFEVQDRALARFLGGFLKVPDPRTAAEKRAHKALERSRRFAKYHARNWPELLVNQFLFRMHRKLTKKLQKKGILPPNEQSRP